ncbi:MAG: acyl-CoA thioesterase [Crocinitomicaceae bacterium]|nr:acyl-CoA thioesterase [Crocinitomicaceae bacterium]
MKYLTSTLEIPIRFSETDAMGVVWHGNYLKFFEDAREHFGKIYGLDNLKIHDKGFFIPIVHSEINHKASLHYGEIAVVHSKLIYKESAKIIFEFEVINKSTEQIAATGSTTQVYLDAETRLLELTKPEFIIEWENKQNWNDEK